MGKWAYETKSEKAIPHLFLGGLGIIGFAVLVLAFAINVNSAPTPPFTSYTQFGHQAGDLGPGVFQGTINDVWDVPGLFFARNSMGIGNAPAVPLAELHIQKSESGANTGILVNNTSSGATSGANITLNSSTSSSGRSYLELITQGGDWIVGSAADILNPKLVIARNGSFAPSDAIVTVDGSGKVGINNNSPNNIFDVTGNIQATQDVCTGLNGGQCLSQMNQTLFLQNGSPYCNPNCSGGNFTTAADKTKTVTCGSGTDPTLIPISCGGRIQLPSGNSLRTYRIDPLYLAMGDTVNGCIMEWDTSNGSIPANTIGFVKAVCVKVNP